MAARNQKQTIQEGARSHYQDGEFYERRYQARVEDLQFYLRVARGRRRILEYGAGAGRLTLPLARAGKKVVAVEPAEPMLTRLRHQLAMEPPGVQRAVTLERADMRTFRTRRRFEMVILAFHTFSHLYSHDEISGFLALAYQHLLPGGVLALDVPMARIDMDGYDPIAQVRVTFFEGPVGPQVLTQRLFQPAELLMHVHYAGFVGARLRADFEDAELTTETDVITLVAKKPKPC